MVLIAVATDFGTRGQHYVAQMKGVALQINPDVRIEDVTHEITPFSIAEAAYVLYTTYDSFPEGTIFVCVVDPGVGSERDILAVQTIDNYIIIGPDNGIFTHFAHKKLIEISIKITEMEFYHPPYTESLQKALSRQSFTTDLQKRIADTSETVQEVAAYQALVQNPDGTEDPNFPAYPLPDREMNPAQRSELDPFDSSLDGDQDFATLQAGSTFHGRDIMMPVAAHIASGLDIFSLGVPKLDVELLPGLEPIVDDTDKILTGMIQYIDSFGNIITNIPSEEFNLLNKNMESVFRLGYEDHNYTLRKVPIFAGQDPARFLLIEGSSGFLEVCQNQNSAAESIDAAVGMPFQLEIFGNDYDEYFRGEE